MLPSVVSSAQTFTTLFSFNSSSGANPSVPLGQGLDGNFYGTTLAGGASSVSNSGTIFTISPAGAESVLYSFCSVSSGGHCLDGAPPGALVQTSNGDLYGTTLEGGTVTACVTNGGCGTIFRITRAGVLTTVYSFCSQPSCADGLNPLSLIQGTNGNFYGVTLFGGTFDGGTVFETTPACQLTTLADFCSTSGCLANNGISPDSLIGARDGNFYGTTGRGGPADGGTVFKMTPAGKLNYVHNFCIHSGCADGESPTGLVEGSDGNLYGTTVETVSTVFKIAPNGVFTTLHTFCLPPSCSDGSQPAAPLVQSSDGNFYGATTFGPQGGGTIFQISPAGALTTLFDLCSQSPCLDAGTPMLMQSTNGTFYGTTEGGSEIGDGVAFSLSTGLTPLADALPAFGKVGWTIDILGNNLPGTTSVTFNGMPATFTVVSGNLIKATVPTGATTGTIEATTPSGTLSSNIAFQVLP